MILLPRHLLPLLISSCLLTAAARAQEDGDSWDARLARSLSGRLAEIGKELESIRSELPKLPAVPVADQGGTGGFASLNGQARPDKEGEFAVEIRLPAAGMVDLVALVPSRRYGVGGLEAQFGMPDEFTVDLLGPDGKAIARIADERALWADPVRAGHPFVYAVSPPVEAAGLRITAGHLRLDPDVSESFVHSWAEAFIFQGEHNLARGATVTSSGSRNPNASWVWSNAFLVDGQTPLGLPEVPAGEHRNVGWISEGRAKASESVWLEVDLGEVREFDTLRLFPAKRPTSDLPSGFGFPRRFTVSVSVPGGPEGEAPAAKVEMDNPGHSPVEVPLGRRKGQKVRIDVSELWKALEHYPAFFALSEVQVLDGEENRGQGAVVRSPDGMGNVIGSGLQYWNMASLSDGFGPDGRLIPRREWLLQLDQRLKLEQKQHALMAESRAIVDGWRRTGLWVFALLGVAGAVVLIALPIRYRMREKRELARVRERIAGDLHDEVGSNLGSIQMLADLAESHAGPTKELKRIQRIAAETVSAVRDIVWLLRPQGDHRIGTAEHLRETGSIMLEALDWEFHANEAAWQTELSDEANRHLFLFYREALHNVLRHSGAARVEIRADEEAGKFRLTVSDDGSGIPPEKLERPSTLRALRQRVEALGAEFKVESETGKGTRLELAIPLEKKRRK
jgi:signal transduction histidine kinase